MFQYEKKEVIKIAQDLNVAKETLERVLRLVDILIFINEDEFLKDKLALKGGTAINLTFYDCLRLSVDIDLDYIGTIDREQMIRDRENIERKLLIYTQESNIKYRKDKSKKTHALDSFVFNYSNLFNATDMIKVEINYMNRVHLFDYEKRNIILPLNKDIEVLTLNKIDLFASKTNALIYRTTIRDIYDVNNMIKNKTISNCEFELYRKSLIFYFLLSLEEKKNLNMLIDECKIRMKSFIGKRIPQYLTSTLKINEKFELKEALENINNLLDEVLNSTTEEEIEFINNFPNATTSLFEIKSLNDRIEIHPMIKWKKTLYK